MYVCLHKHVGLVKYHASVNTIYPDRLSRVENNNILIEDVKKVGSLDFIFYYLLIR